MGQNQSSVYQYACFRWIFWTKKYDIKFSIVHHDESGEKADIISARRVTCNVVPEDGCCQSTKDGTCTLYYRLYQ